MLLITCVLGDRWWVVVPSLIGGESTTRYVVGKGYAYVWCMGGA